MLPAEEVRTILIARNGDAGARGGSIGGAIGGSIGGGGALPGAVGGSSGGRAGGRLGAKLFTRVMGQSRTLPVPYTRHAHATMHRGLAPALVSEARAGGQVQGVLVGLVGTGWWNMNSAVIQVVWFPDRAEVTAHALEGLVNQRSVPRALDVVEHLLSPYLSHRRH
ncbi:hypothetical protein [Georgenia sp. MJ170]|uniref:hypothetical protein n=1 Tax=Georgenia sunbinii TaxID=3117728 RepID=UPI002F266856